jgi:hypothetical protein
LRPRLGPRLRLLLSSFTIQLLQRFRDLDFGTSASPSFHPPSASSSSKYFGTSIRSSASPSFHPPSPSRSSKAFGTTSFQHLYFETSVRSSALPSSAFTIEVLKSLWDVLNSGTSFLRPQWGPRFQLLPSSYTIQILKSFRDTDFETSVRSSASTSSLLLHHPDPQKLSGHPRFRDIDFETSVRSSASTSSLLLHHPDPQKLSGHLRFRDIDCETLVRY